ncbi:hypothetical protein HDU97_007701 [Phlyctochytrium planicorne]|nr:hypothetical protein HDU97_007701 [Phlyctochytrium planicorne]
MDPSPPPRANGRVVPARGSSLKAQQVVLEAIKQSSAPLADQRQPPERTLSDPSVNKAAAPVTTTSVLEALSLQIFSVVGEPPSMAKPASTPTPFTQKPTPQTAKDLAAPRAGSQPVSVPEKKEINGHAAVTPTQSSSTPTPKQTAISTPKAITSKDQRPVSSEAPKFKDVAITQPPKTNGAADTTESETVPSVVDPPKSAPSKPSPSPSPSSTPVKDTPPPAQPTPAPKPPSQSEPEPQPQPQPQPPQPQPQQQNTNMNNKPRKQSPSQSEPMHRTYGAKRTELDAQPPQKESPQPQPAASSWFSSFSAWVAPALGVDLSASTDTPENSNTPPSPQSPAKAPSPRKSPIPVTPPQPTPPLTPKLEPKTKSVKFAIPEQEPEEIVPAPIPIPQEMLANLNPSLLPEDSFYNNHPMLGIHVSYFSRFITICGGRKALKGKTTFDVCEDFVKPKTSISRLSFCEQLYLLQLSDPDKTKSPKVAAASYYISHAWDADFLQLLDTIELWFQEHNIPNGKSFVWLDIFSESQSIRKGYEKRPEDYFSNTLPEAIRKIGRMLMVLSPWDEPIAFKRAWCLYELYTASKLNIQFDIAFPEGERVKPLGAGISGLVSNIMNVDQDILKADYEADRDEIISYISADIGFSALESLVKNIMFAAIDKEMASTCRALRSKDRLEDAIAIRDYMIEFYVRYEDFKSAAMFSEENLLDMRTIAGDDAYTGPIAQTIVDIATFHLQLRHLDVAEQRFLESFENEMKHSKDKTFAMNSASQLVTMYRALNRMTEAEKFARFNLDQSRKDMEPTDPEILVAMDQLIDLYAAQKRTKEIEPLLVECVETSKKVLGPLHVLSVRRLNALATCYASQGRREEAEPLLRYVVDARRGRKEEHDILLTNLVDLGNIYMDMGKFEMAQNVYEDYITVSKVMNVLGKNGSDIEVLRMLVDAYAAQDKLSESAETLVLYISVAKSRYGQSHPEVMGLYQEVIGVYDQLGLDTEKANVTKEMESIAKPGSDAPNATVDIETVQVTVSKHVIDYEGISLLGLPVAFITGSFVELCGGRSALTGKSTVDINKEFVIPMTQKSRLSLCQQYNREQTVSDPLMKPARATWFISHVWNYKFLDVVDALKRWFDKSGEDPRKTFVWMDLFSTSQHSMAVRKVDWWSHAFLSSVGSLGQVLMVLQPWDGPIPLTRAWCLFELYACAKTNGRFEIAFLPGDLSQLGGTGIETFLKLIKLVRSEKSECLITEDCNKMHQILKESIGFASLDRLAAVKLRDALESHLKRDLEYFDDKKKLADPVGFLKAQNDLGLFYSQTDRSDEAEALYLDSYERLNELKHPFVLRAMQNLSSFYSEVFNLDEAERIAMECLDRCAEFGEEGEKEKPKAQSILGTVYEKQGMFEETRPLYENVLAVERQVHGDGHIDTLKAMNNLANLYSQMELHAEAEELFVECLTGRRTALGLDHVDTLITANHLAALYQRMGKHSQAEPLHLECHANKVKLLGEEHQDVWFSMNNLSMLYQDMGRMEEAEKLLRESLELAKRVFGEHHRNTIRSLNNLSAYHVRCGDLPEAESVLREVVERCEKGKGLDVMSAKYDLGVVLKDQDKYGEAEPMLVSAFELAKQELTLGHVKTIAINLSLAKLYESIGKKELASQHFEIAVTEGAARTGNTTEVLMAYVSLSKLYGSLGQTENLISTLRRAKAACEQSIGEKDDLTFKMTINLANTLFGESRYDEAAEVLKSHLRSLEAAKGPTDESTLDCLLLLAVSLIRSGDLGRGRDVMEVAIERYAEVYGPDHDNTEGLRDLLRSVGGTGKGKAAL